MFESLFNQGAYDVRRFSYLRTVMTIGLVLTSLSATAQEKIPAEQQKTIPSENPPPVTPKSEPDETIALAPEGQLPTKVYRALSRGTVMVHLSPFSTWLPMKYGLNAGYIAGENWTWEFEYIQRFISGKVASVDFGKIQDERYGLQARWYPGANSFHLIMGLFKNTFSMELGNSMISAIGSVPPVTVWKLESIGPQLGLGNRWQWTSGVTFGVDWFLMYLPVFNKKVDDRAFDYVTNQNDRDDLDNVSRIINNIPQFDVLRFHLGYTF